ncbi:MAG: endopeptidase La [SAR324 cluster bacterium]|nr:endopeptidase La [SAR324 cluster bacterium]
MSEKPKEVIDGTVSEELSEEEEIPTRSIVLASEVLPDILPIFPIPDRPMFPKMMAPLVIMEPVSKRVMLDILKSSEKATYIGLLLMKPTLEGIIKKAETAKDLYQVGTVGKVLEVQQADQNQPIHVMVQVLERFKIIQMLKEAPAFQAKVEYWHSVEMEKNEELKAYSVSIIDAMKELIQKKPMFREELNLLLSRLNVNEPGTLADFSAAMTSSSAEELQEILETRKIRPRIEKSLILLKKELEISKLQGQINKRIEERLTTQQREFFLREQLKEIKKELGITKDDKESEADKFKKRLSRLTLTEEAQERIDEELEKLQLLEPSSPEFNVTRSYLDWLTILPWGRYSQDKYDLKRAEKILNRDHFGLKDVKERILEFISVGKVKGNLSGSMILLIGPPGTGKTSIGQSIAKSIGREFFRFSLGGMRDEAEIKGHRRTYIGALPGKFINAIKTCKTSNPLIMLDEIDKIGASFQGDPASALLEVLDPEQNKDFLDHYLDIRFDLSKVLFICTANQLETIPRPLLDRMEIIPLSGYILEEKVQIAKRHLIPKQLKAHGLTKRQVSLPDTVIRDLIDGYAREAGVRGLENQIKKIYRKVTKQIVEEDVPQVKLKSSDLQKLLGRRVFHEEQLYKKPRVGVVMGLAYTSMGGATLFIEATKIASKSPGFKRTGQLGDVMLESSEIAYTHIRSLLSENKKHKEFFDKHFVHLHVPAGATPKDGPSAGITMACALYSLAINRPIKANLAMTGELSLTGLVMPIGGLKEKLIAAKRAGVTEIIFPLENKDDFDDLEDYLKEGITTNFVNSFEQVLKICFAK